MGWVPWNLSQTKAIDRVLYWKGILAKSRGQSIGSLVLWHQAKKGGVTHNLNAMHWPAEQLQAELMWAYRQYDCLKKDPNWRDQWIGQLVDVQAQATGQKKAAIWKQMQWHKQIHKMAQQVKHALGKVSHHHTLVVVNAPNLWEGCWVACHMKVALEMACLAEAGQ